MNSEVLGFFIWQESVIGHAAGNPIACVSEVSLAVTAHPDSPRVAGKRTSAWRCGLSGRSGSAARVWPDQTPPVGALIRAVVACQASSGSCHRYPCGLVGRCPLWWRGVGVILG